MSTDCKKNEVFNLNQEKNILDCNTKQSVALFVFCFENKLCAKMMFSFHLRLQIMNENLHFCTMMYMMAMTNGIDCYNNPTLLICIGTIHLDWMGLNCYI